jgi:sRNA-binding carbon storage regulator CsrA
VPVHREEIYERIKREREAANAVPPPEAASEQGGNR